VRQVLDVERGQLTQADAPEPWPDPTAQPTVTDSGTPVTDGSDLETAVMVTLARYSQAETPRGVVALALARRIDRGIDTGSAIAALSRELRSILDDMSGALRAPDIVDDLIARRAARMAEAGRRQSVIDEPDDGNPA